MTAPANHKPTLLLQKTVHSTALVQPEFNQMLTLFKLAANQNLTLVLSSNSFQSDSDSCTFKTQPDFNLSAGII